MLSEKLISYFGSARQSKKPLQDCKVGDFLAWVKGGQFINAALDIRGAIATGGKKSQKVENLKKSIPAITPSGTFSERNLASLGAYSGLMDIDLDNIPPKEIPAVKRQLASLDFIYAAYVSISGGGIAALAVVGNDPQQHAQTARQIQTALALDGIEVDCLIDFTRLRFVSHDPELYLNERAVPFNAEKYLGKEVVITDDRPQQYGPNEEFFTDEENVAFAIEKVEIEHAARDGRNNFVYYFAKYANRLGVAKQTAVSAAWDHCQKNPRPDADKKGRFSEREVSLIVDRVYKEKLGDNGSQRRPKTIRKSRVRMRGESGHSSYIPTFASILSGEDIIRNPHLRESLVFKTRIQYGIKEPLILPTVLSYTDGAEEYTFARAGDVSLNLGQQKSGKSELISAQVAACIAQHLPEEQRAQLKTLGFKAAPNPSGKATILIDSEQSEGDCYDLGLKVGRRADRIQLPGNFLHHQFRPLDITERAEAFVEVLRYANSVFGGIFAIFIDNPVDFLKNPNDYAESSQLINLLLQLSSFYNCPIISVFHTNPNSAPKGGGVGKARGHAGSIALRWCSAALHSGWDPKVGAYHVTFPEMRKAPRGIDFYMKWDKEIEGLAKIGGGNAPTPGQFQKKINRRGFLISVIGKVFPPGTDYLDQSTVIEYICYDDRIKDELDARKIVADMFSHRLLEPMEGAPNLVRLGDSFPYRR